MLRGLGKPALLLKLGDWRCVCMRSGRLEPGLRARLRALVLAGYACWCDRSDGG
jgi:hypothetical protein